MDSGSNINEKGYHGRTPLHCASRNYNVSNSIIELLNRGADITVKDDFGDTPLDIALDINKRLIEEYFDIPIKEPEQS